MRLKLLILMALIICTFHLHLSAAQYETIPEKGKLPILTAAFKDQKTAKIRLSNGLEAYLISNPDLNLSGAMMSVNAGSWEDPQEYPGLAHFLEHMLFMGTRAYPDESEYSRFISENGGQTNAFTSSNTTNYLFTIQNNAFKEAFKRFSSFFKEPLFNPSGVSRELKAIDQEYAKNLENDSIRQYYVLKALTDPKHPFHQFNIGNSKTLDKVSQSTLRKWYQDHYSAHLMRLIVYSSLPIDELKTFVADQLSDIPSHDKAPYVNNQPSFPKNLSGEVVYIDPIKETQKLTIFWELPPKFAHLIDSKPEELIAYILGYEGDKSLLANLKKDKLAESLSSGGMKAGDNLFILYVQIDLTNSGVVDVDKVMTRVFQTIEQMRREGIPPYIFEEVQTMQRLQYQYQSREDEFYTLLMHGYTIQDEKMETYPEKTKVIQIFDPEAVQEMLSYLTPEHALLFVMAPQRLTGVKPTLQEKWMGVSYAIKPVSPDLSRKWKHLEPHQEIAIPLHNPFIPTNLELVDTSLIQDTYQIPEVKILSDDSASKFYFAQDNYFGVPKISWSLLIKTPQVTQDDPLKAVFTDIYIKYVKDVLDKFSYPAKMAGLDYEIERKNNGIQVTLNGYSENGQFLWEEILQQMVTLNATPEKYKIYKESVSREYHNHAKASPLEQSIDILKSLMYEDYATNKEKASASGKASFKKFNEWLRQLYLNTYTEGMFYGNLSESQAREAMELTKKSFYNGVYPQSEQKLDKVIVLPETQGPFYLELHTKAQGNAALLMIENTRFSFKERAAQQILMTAIKQPFFEELRTKQQTGYIVDSFAQEIEKKLFNLFVVQSNSHDPQDLLYRFETFIENYLQEIGKAELTEEQFETIKQALLQNLEQPANNIKEMGKLLAELMVKHDGDFLWMDKRKKGMQSLTYSEMLQLSREMLGRQNKQRLAILLDGEIPDTQAFTYHRARNRCMIKKTSKYEASTLIHSD
ncbi:insulinase family protein [Waddlia chondrophila]|uniref:Protease 3 n=1 Tax=Waddlia chondrophila (strain ATCC VR-1470 / WSU 86-1044) TaxID=716544 RepID=D6YUF9_WADCW|nr:insulinase family protein [Waddlia chondrophila]ADI37770.1 putative ptr insulinase family/protease III [Waddlia chondrophila WSU 86-1044]